ncbi:unnamed protein product [Mytilus coruscus]|uniref:Ig-like domain-containing protein n=1 Tax=Mytilus coruscus TaxID=42192 RepID=A0A6J8BPS4_MYTCO|nr:unnamed protein product [Mytilus coruscus]
METIYNPYIVSHKQRNIVLTCVIDYANPSKAVLYERNSPSGTVNTQNLTIPTVTNLHSGQYPCTATNIADRTRPYSPGHVTATKNSTLRLTLTINANPVPTIEWTSRADKDWNSCNFNTIVSNTTINGFINSSSILINNVNSSNFGDYVFTARNTAGVFFRRFVAMKEDIPNIHREPIYNPYIVYHKQRNIVLTCVIDNANPSKAVLYEWNSPSGTVNTQNLKLTIPTVTNLHSGQYSCTATNIADTSNKTTKQINVHYGPMISNISNQYDITEGNNLVVSPIVDANPASKLVWWTKQNDENFRYDGFVLRINNIDRKSSGNYSCYVMNTLAPFGMAEINRTTHQTFYINVVYYCIKTQDHYYLKQHDMSAEEESSDDTFLGQEPQMRFSQTCTNGHILLEEIPYKFSD